MNVKFDNKLNTIFLDMDGVLADFDKRVNELFINYDYNEHDENRYWNLIKGANHFFLSLKPTSYAHSLVSLAKALCDDVQILTALPQNTVIEHAEEDKRAWINKYFPNQNLKFNIGPYSTDKWKHAKPGDILVDDRKSNIHDWKQLGKGLGILHNYFDFKTTAAELIKTAGKPFSK